MKTLSIAIATIFSASAAGVLYAHGPNHMQDPAMQEKMAQMMNDPAHKEMMQNMMKQKSQAAGGHQHGAATPEQKDWGIAGDPKAVTRVIHIEMTDDMRFTPNEIVVKKGETIRFHVANKGKVLHEMVIGTKKELDAHAEMMKKFPNMEHDEPYMAHVDPGKAAPIVWLFNREGNFEYACLIPGHYQAGMVGKIKVTP